MNGYGGIGRKFNNEFVLFLMVILSLLLKRTSPFQHRAPRRLLSFSTHHSVSLMMLRACLGLDESHDVLPAACVLPAQSASALLLHPSLGFFDKVPLKLRCCRRVLVWMMEVERILEERAIHPSTRDTRQVCVEFDNTGKAVRLHYSAFTILHF